MTQGWCVRVSVFDDLVVSLSEREVAGSDLSQADQDLIRDCARHLLAFVGSGPVADFAVDPPVEGRERGLRALQDSSSSSSTSLPPGEAPPQEKPENGGFQMAPVKPMTTEDLPGTATPTPTPMPGKPVSPPPTPPPAPPPPPKA
jgi:hypothetical protein